MTDPTSIVGQLRCKLGEHAIKLQHTADGIATCWIARQNFHDALRFLKEDVTRPYRMLYDLTAIDERMRMYREGQPPSDFTIVYHLLSFGRNEYLRVKVPLKQDQPPIDTATDLWPAANWYEREVWGMFGIRFQGHPHLERILMPRTWVEIDFHDRAEKMGERQSSHSYIPCSDRIDYPGGVMNNMAYLMAVEKLAGIEVPPRAKVIRVMLAELFRIIGHLVWCGTFAQDLGHQSPVFDTFNDRERAFVIIETVCGAVAPNWFRVGGVARDLPKGWDTLVRDFVKYLKPRLIEYDKKVMRNRIFKARTQGVGAFTTEEAIEWGVTGPNLRACGLEWDFRKKQPYSGYEQFEFDVSTGRNGDCYDRGLVRVEEIRQSLRIVEQCANNMPEAPYTSAQPPACPPSAERAVIPPGEALGAIEATEGNNGYYLVSDGGAQSYRTRIRTPSFAHMQMARRQGWVCRNGA
jgi:NADH:ubiquinone oxidoreductase subunit D/NADH:ubiquinone oxidoreductase subunit C